MISLAALAVLSGLSLNLLLQFAIGATGVAGDTRDRGAVPFFQFGIMFLAVIVLWVFFAVILPPLWTGFVEYFLFFPLSALVCMGFERLTEKILPKFGPRVFHALTGYDGLVPISLLITFTLAGDFGRACTLAFFFALGNLTAMLIVSEIRRKSTMERVPVFLRGSPLVLISMGLLSLITGAAAGICFRVLELF